MIDRGGGKNPRRPKMEKIERGEKLQQRDGRETHGRRKKIKGKRQ